MVAANVAFFFRFFKTGPEQTLSLQERQLLKVSFLHFSASAIGGPIIRWLYFVILTSYCCKQLPPPEQSSLLVIPKSLGPPAWPREDVMDTAMYVATGKNRANANSLFLCL